MPISRTIFRHNPQLMEIVLCSRPSYSDIIAIKFCTWPNSCVVVACAKCCSGMVPYNGVTVIPIFHRIWSTMEKSFLKWAPGFHHFHYDDVIIGAIASLITSLTMFILKRLFRRRSKKTSKLRVTGLCVGNSPGTGDFPAQMASNAENVPVWWRHHGYHKIHRYELITGKRTDREGIERPITQYVNSHGDAVCSDVTVGNWNKSYLWSLAKILKTFSNTLRRV